MIEIASERVVGHIIGIDLGTTNTCAAVLEAGLPAIIPSAEGGRTTPSVVAVNGRDEMLVGITAKRQVATNPLGTIASAKRLIGRQASDPEIAQTASRLGCRIETNESSGEVRVRLGSKVMSVPEISAVVLRKIKADASAYLGEVVHQAVITVPAYFDETQRQATITAGKLAGLEVLRLINEPTAAALAYGVATGRSRRIAVCDLGGGTFDVSILEVGDGVCEVRATGGDAELGGDDWDALLVDLLARRFERAHHINPLSDPAARGRLRDAAESAKIELSTLSETTVNLPFLIGQRHLESLVTRAEFEDLASDLIRRLDGPIMRAFQDAGVGPDDLEEVLLVGGMTRMPSVAAALRHRFGREPRRGVDPDTAVAAGAAVQAGLLSGSGGNVVLVDVIAQALGIETVNHEMSILIERNAAVPASATREYTPATDYQTDALVEIFEGEAFLANDNHRLGMFDLPLDPPRPSDQVKIDVTFTIDVSGTLSVEAVDRGTHVRRTIVIDRRPARVTGALGSGWQDAAVVPLLHSGRRAA